MANPTYQSGFYAPGRGTSKYPALWDGCVGAWNPGLGNTGLSLRDWSGNQNNGVLTNGPTWGVSGGRQALTFDGVNDYISCQRSPVSGNTAISISAWVKQTIDRNGDHAIKFGAASVNAGFGIFKGTGVIKCGLHASSEVVLSWGAYVEKWTHVFAMVRPGYMALYINGVLGGSTTSVAAYSIGTSFCNIGAAQSALAPWIGQLGDIRVFASNPTDSVIRLLAQRPGIAYERAPRKFYSLPAAAASSRQYRLFRPSILRGA